MGIPSMLDVAKTLVQDTTAPGDVAIDATVGNGHDTLTLAQAVGAEGRVLGLDVQAEALQSARKRLQQAGMAERVSMVHGGHEDMAAHVPDGWRENVSVVMFNLGYLPGSDKSCITRPDTTRRALEAAAALLKPGGLITVVLYTGHDGGREEAEAVRTWAEALDEREWVVLSYRLINQSNDPPRLLAIERRTG